MNVKHDMRGILLAAVTGLACLIAMLTRAFLPRMILPHPDGITMIILSLVTLAADYYLFPESEKTGRRNYLLRALYAALVFGLFPWASCFLTVPEALKTAVLGAVLFTVLSLLFDSISSRLASGPAAKAAPLISGVLLFLAAQCLMGIL